MPNLPSDLSAMSQRGRIPLSPAQFEPELRVLSDDALVRETLPLARHFGCNVVVAVLVVAVVTIASLGWRVGAWSLVVGGALGALTMRVRAATPRMRRARAAEREFGRRFGAEPLAQLLPDAKAQFGRDADLDVLALFRAVALPHGGLRLMRVELRAQPTVAVSTSPFLAELQRGEPNLVEVAHRKQPLDPIRAERLRALLRELRPELLTAPGNFVRDGFLCEALVLQRDAPELHARGNLAGLPEALRAHPTVRLFELLLDFEQDLDDVVRR